MAKQLDGWPVGLEARKGPETQYPWNDWLNGAVWQLTQGEDYKIKTKSFRTAAQAYARKRGGRLKAVEINNGQAVVMQFVRTLAAVPDAAPAGPPPPPPSPGRSVARDESSVIRAWAKANGWPHLGEFGRLPGDVLEAYDRAREHPQS